MGEHAAFIACETPQAGDRAARLGALLRLLDWAEREAQEVAAPECALCLQLARVAVQNRLRDGA